MQSEEAGLMTKDVYIPLRSYLTSKRKGPKPLSLMDVIVLDSGPLLDPLLNDKLISSLLNLEFKIEKIPHINII